MSAREFYLPAAKERVAAVIGRIEQRTAAEVVVSVRPRSGHYRHTDYLVGLSFLMIGLGVFLFAPAPFDEDLFPVEALALFGLGTWLSASVPDLRRWLTAPSLMAGAVAKEARAAFVELGVSRTARRTGMLVLVSVQERRVEVVVDVALQPLQADPKFQGALRELSLAMRPPRFAAFLSALESLGPVLEACAPRAHDDVNELADELHVS